MGKLITVVGNSGVGKTTLVRRLCEVAPLLPALEQHAQRPFQRLFAENLTRYGFANQVDYLLLRAEQEQVARSGNRVWIHDGGLDLDFYGFAHLFRCKGYLTEAEFMLCGRLYAALRACLPPPEVVVYLAAPVELAAARHQVRNRSLEITQVEDLLLLGELIENWIVTVPPQSLLRVDASAADHGNPEQVATLARLIGDRLGA